MTIERATARRILELCTKNNISVAALTNSAGVNPSTVYEFLAGRTKCPTVAVIKQLCAGFGITVAEFFSQDYFE
ncbi:MAG: helix-turn-helix domain-containing protein [Clostridiales bacterium]|jgi:transcriptional regulator with XRE-family HTH domain|nr:helix-turn-helix domain-containing protein [Clostridiales bacterium]